MSSVTVIDTETKVYENVDNILVWLYDWCGAVWPKGAELYLNDKLLPLDTADQIKEPVSYTHLTLPTTPYV